MRKYCTLSSVLLLATAAFFSCSKEQQDDSTHVREGFVKVMLTASGEDNDTKTIISDGQGSKRTVEWEKGDRIRVWYGSGSTESEAVESGKVTNFSLEIPASTKELWAVYPSTVEASAASRIISVTIPSVQDGAFAKANIAVAMTVPGAENCQFFNATSYVKFTVTDPDITLITVESVGGEPMVGTLPLSFAPDGSVVPGTPAQTSSSVRLKVDGVGDYYIAILPGMSYEQGLKVRFYIDGKGQSDLGRGTYTTRNAVSVQRSQIASFGALDQKVGNIYVTVNGAGLKDGSSWDNAYSNTELANCLTVNTDAAAVKAKCQSLEGYTFRLGAGVYDLGYSPVVDFTHNGEVCNLRFVGGYAAAGSESSDPSTNASVLTGAGDHACIVLKSNVSAIFSGITFSGAVVWRDHEAALQLYDGAHAQLSGCTLKDNRISDGMAVSSAAVFVDAMSSLEASSCMFCDNTGLSGCAMEALGAVSVSGSSFLRNSASERGAAVCVSNQGPVKAIFENCEFKENTVPETEGKTGGAVAFLGGNACLQDCTFEGNSAYQGGAVALAGKGDLEISGSRFYRNHALWKYNEEANSYGGAIDITGAGTLKADRCSFDGNYATRGGAISSQDGMAKIFLNACVFAKNYIINGHGTDIYIAFSELCALNNCCFIEGSYSTLGSGNADWIGLESVGTFLLANSSMIGSPLKSALDTTGSNGLVRLGYVGATEYFINNIMALPNTNSNTSINARSDLHTVYMFGNKCSKVTEGGSTFVRNYGNCEDYLQGTGYFNELALVSSENIAWDNTWWSWNGSMGNASDTSKMAASDVLRLMNEVSSEFCGWLTDGCGDAISKDQLGTLRSGAYWPGSYQK